MTSCVRSFSFLIVILALIAIHPLARAQGRATGERAMPLSGTIAGVVRNSDGGTPVEFVTVTLESNGGGIVSQTRTDRSGKFKFDNLGHSNFRISIRHPGFQEIQRFIDLTLTATEYLQIQLVAEKSTAPVSAALLDASITPEAHQEYEKGRTALMDEKNLPSGIIHLEKAISLAPKYAEAHLLLGTAFLDNKQLDKAERELHKTLEIKPQTAAALFSLGDVHRRQQKYADAEKDLLDGLKLEPKSAQGHFTLGQVYFAKGDLTKAGPEVGQTLQLKPDFAEAYLLAGNLFMKARKAENALPMFEEYLRLAPKGESAPQTREMVEKIKKALAEKK